VTTRKECASSAHLLLLRNHPAAAFLIQSKGHTGAGFPTVCAHSTIGSLLPIDSTSLLHLELGTVRCGPATGPWSVVARIRPVHRSPSVPTFEAGFQTWFSPSRWPCPKPSVSLAGCGGRARGGDFVVVHSNRGRPRSPYTGWWWSPSAPLSPRTHPARSAVVLFSG
jgi:hypothetical protein